MVLLYIYIAITIVVGIITYNPIRNRFKNFKNWHIMLILLCWPLILLFVVLLLIYGVIELSIHKNDIEYGDE